MHSHLTSSRSHLDFRRRLSKDGGGRRRSGQWRFGGPDFSGIVLTNHARQLRRCCCWCSVLRFCAIVETPLFQEFDLWVEDQRQTGRERMAEDHFVSLS